MLLECTVHMTDCRAEDVITDIVLRDMVRNWHPGVQRTATGYYKNMSVLQRVDPFTLQVSGTAAKPEADATAPPSVSE